MPDISNIAPNDPAYDPERKPYDQATQVGLECPSCGAYKNVPRYEVPFKVKLIRSECYDCHVGDRHTETWYSAPGVEVSQDDREGYPETRVCSPTEFLLGSSVKKGRYVRQP